MNTGCALATLAPNSTMRSLSMTSVYEHVVAADADRLLQRGGRRRVAHPRRVVDVVGAEEARDLLRDVVRLVGDAARGEVDREAVGCRGADAIGDQVERLVPRDPGEAGLAGAPHHRVRAAARARAAPVAVSRRSGATSASDCGGRARAIVLTRSRLRRVVHRCTPESVQSWKPATPSAQPSHTPLLQDAPRVREVVAVLPDGA